MNLLDIRDAIGVRLFGMNLSVEVNGGCTFRCPSCPVGNTGPRPGGVMDVGYFQRIIDKATSEFRVRKFFPAIWNEPFLHPHLPELIAVARRSSRVDRIIIPTNLSVMDNMEAVLSEGPDELTVSWSGFRHYEDYHRGGDLWEFLLNATELSRLSRKYSDTKIVLLFHAYADNHQDLDASREYAEFMGFSFRTIDAVYRQFERMLDGDYTDDDLALIKRLVREPWKILDERGRSDYCFFQNKWMMISSTGQIEPCCLYDPSYYLGDYLSLTRPEIRRRKKQMSFCSDVCKPAGGNNYYN